MKVMSKTFGFVILVVIMAYFKSFLIIFEVIMDIVSYVRVNTRLIIIK